MTKQEREQIAEIKSKLESIYKWDNKNLLLRQYYKLDDSLQIINKLLKETD